MSPVYVRPEPDALLVSFERDGEPAEEHRVKGSKDARAAALRMLLERTGLIDGDRLTVKAD